MLKRFVHNDGLKHQHPSKIGLLKNSHILSLHQGSLKRKKIINVHAQTE